MIAIGTAVIISDKSDAYAGKYRGKEAVIERVHSDSSYGVRIEGATNPSSAYGIFWIPAGEITINHLKNEEIIMLDTYTRVAAVRFLDNPGAVMNNYAYALYDSDICVGDTVAVRTGHHGFALAIIDTVADRADGPVVNCGREIVAKVDFAPYEKRKDAATRYAKLQKDLAAQAAAVQKTLLYEMLAEKDPNMKAMLEELHELESIVKG